MKVPKIGMRMFKTALAVLFCLLIEIILRYLTNDEIATIFYSPFFSGLAAIYSLNNRKENSIALARMRAFGSILGGTFGILFLYIVYALLFYLNLVESTLIFDSIRYIFVSLGVLLLIYLLVHLKWQHMVFIATLTFLAVAVGNRSELPYYIYAINRTGSTIAGVLISISVNFISFHFYKNKSISIVTSVDGVLLRQNSLLSNYQKFNLSMLLDDHLDLYINTSRSPASLIPIFQDLNIKNSFIVMDGSAIYSFSERQFNTVIHIPKEVEYSLHQLLDTYQLNYFSHVVVDHQLHIYYKNLFNEGDRLFFHTRKNEFFRHFSKTIVPNDEFICYDMIVVASTQVTELITRINHLHLPLNLSVFPFTEQHLKDFHLIRITSIHANKNDMFKQTKIHKHNETIIAFGHRVSDLAYFKDANLKICFKDADKEILTIADHVIDGTSGDAIIPIIKRLYYRKNSTKYYTKTNKGI